MRFDEWQIALQLINKDVEQARDAYDDRKAVRDQFFKQTLGFEPGNLATLEGTVQMISKNYRYEKS